MNKEKLIGFDFEGWPIEKMSVKDIIQNIGGHLNKETGMWEIPDSDKLDIYPILLEDDGMGYGVHEQYITEVSFSDDFCSIFRDTAIAHPEVWLEHEVIPGNVIKIDGQDYMLDTVVEKDGDFVFNCRKYDYSEENEMPHIEISKETFEFSVDIIDQNKNTIINGI